MKRVSRNVVLRVSDERDRYFWHRDLSEQCLKHKG